MGHPRLDFIVDVAMANAIRVLSYPRVHIYHTTSGTLHYRCIVKCYFVLTKFKSSINMLMDYAKHYQALIVNAVARESTDALFHTPYYYTEAHHILPLSCGGADVPANIIRLTLHEHLVAHILLFKMGFETQIYSVAAILSDYSNKHCRQRFKHPKLRPKRWVRRQVAVITAKRARERRKAEQLAAEYVATGKTF